MLQRKLMVLKVKFIFNCSKRIDMNFLQSIAYHESMDQACFSDFGVSEEDDLEEKLVSVGCGPPLLVGGGRLVFTLEVKGGENGGFVAAELVELWTVSGTLLLSQGVRVLH